MAPPEPSGSFDALRPTSPGELAAVYRLVAQLPPGRRLETTGWTVLQVSPPASAQNPASSEEPGWSGVSSAAAELRRFGVEFRVAVPSTAVRPGEDVPGFVAPVPDDCHAATPAGTYLLGGPLHGRYLPPAEETRLTAVVTLLGRHRLGRWRDQLVPPPVLHKHHKPGSDSTGVVQFEVGGRSETGGPVVAKIGPRPVIEAETRFVRAENAAMRSAGRRPLFPEVYAVDVEGEQATSLMEACVPVPVARLFADEARTVPAPDAAARLEGHLAALAEWYRLTAEPGRQPTAADYLYRGRFTALRSHPAFRHTFAERFPGTSQDAVLDLPVRLPGGELVAGYTAATGWLDTTAKRLLPTGGSRVHGDIGLGNLLQRTDGSPVFIDPRTVWDGVERPDIGFGDPVFDLATLLHGVLPMAAILHALDTGRSQDLLDLTRVDLGAQELDLSSLTLPVAFSDEVRALQRRLLAVSPLAEPEGVVHARLYIGAATSLAGWLKYDRSLSTPESWLATYAFLVWYLSQAKAVCAAHNLETT